MPETPRRNGIGCAAAHVLTWTDLYTLESFVATTSGVPGGLWYDWPGDQLGRWLSLVHVPQGCGWSAQAWPPRVLADTLLPYQTVDGNFGNCAPIIGLA